MRYVEFRDAIEGELLRVPAGLTWLDLKKRTASCTLQNSMPGMGQGKWNVK